MSHNNITGDRLISKPSTQEYNDNWDLIFSKRVLTPIEDYLKEYSPEPKMLAPTNETNK